MSLDPAAVTWIAPDVERSDGYPARRNAPDLLREAIDGSAGM